MRRRRSRLRALLWNVRSIRLVPPLGWGQFVGVKVGVGVRVRVGVGVLVGVCVMVGVLLGVGEKTGVSEGVGVNVEVAVGVGVWVGISAVNEAQPLVENKPSAPRRAMTIGAEGFIAINVVLTAWTRSPSGIPRRFCTSRH